MITMAIKQCTHLEWISSPEQSPVHKIMHNPTPPPTPPRAAELETVLG